MRYTEDFIAKIREASNLVEIIGQYTELKGSHRLMGRCPFPDHADRSPSFSVSPDQQLYYCYGCKKGGNAFTFLESYNGLSFPEAVEFLARRAGIPLPERQEPARKRSPDMDFDRDVLLKINRMAAVHYYKQLRSASAEHPAKTYMQSRGLNPEVVEIFRLGYASPEWRGLATEMRNRNVPTAALEVLGLIRAKKDSRGPDAHFDLFRDRLMFPIFSAAGEVIGFGGRTLTDALPKYVNSADSVLFNKSKVLYGLHETGRHIRSSDSAIIVEGYMDAITLFAAGIKNVAAILGTALTLEHAKIIKRYTPNVTILLDGDEAGLNGAERSLPILLAAGLMPRGCALPEGLDPDEYVREHGSESLQVEIDKAPELFSLLLKHRWMLGYRGTNVEKVAIAEKAAEVLLQAKSSQLAELYAMDLARQLEVDLQWVRKFLRSPEAGHARPQSKPESVSGTRGPVRPDSFRPPDPLNSPAGEASLSGRPDDEPDVREPEPLPPDPLALAKAPRDEVRVLSLLVKHQGLMHDLIEAGPDALLSLISNADVKKAVNLVVERYQIRPESFGQLVAWLMDRVDRPGLLAEDPALGGSKEREAVTADPLAIETLAKKVMTDYVLALQKRAFAQEAKALEKQIRDQPTEERLAEFMTLQRNRMNIKPTDS